jgi:hypothetical protein
LSALLRSGLFAGAQFAASFAVILLIARSASPEARSGFFAAQAAILAITTAFGQTLALRYFHNQQSLVAKALISALFLTTVLVWWISSNGLIDMRDIPFYALSGPLIIAGAHGSVRMQQAPTHVFWLLGISALRILICMAALQMGLPVSVAFALNAAIFSCCFLLGEARQATAPPKAEMLLSLLIFFALSGFTFQWDRLLLAGKNAPELIVESGIFLLWSLPPVSILFTTLTRANPALAFATNRGENPKPLSKTTIGFTLSVALYACTVVLFWTPLNALLFPFFTGSRWLALLLIAALYFDRLGMLALFQMRSKGITAIALKVVPMSVAIMAAVLTEPTLLGLYSLYFATSLVFAFGMWWRR